MIRKWSFYSIGLFCIYSLFMYWYFFYFADTSIPFEYQQTAADPATFLDAKEIMLNDEYAKWRNFLYFVGTPFEWLMYILLLITGLNKFLFKMGQEGTNNKFLKVPVYIFWVSLVTTAIMLPILYFSYYLSKMYQLSVQSFPSWMKEQLIDFWIFFFVAIILFTFIYFLMRKFPNMWWFVAWMISIPVILFTMYVYPVVIEPMYNEFTPIQNKELETKIISLAEQANIPATHVFQVNMSEKTNAMNAYVTGIGDNARIVLWDTTLQKLTDEEILYIMAHEIAHYVDKDIYKGIIGYLIFALVAFYAIAKIYNYLLARYAQVLKVEEPTDVKGYPLLLLLLSIMLFVASPVTNYVSRVQERQADTYATELLQNPDVGISMQQKLVKENRSQVNPPLLVKVMKSTHPSALERISTLELYKIEQRNKLKE